MADVLDGFGDLLSDQHIATLAKRLNAKPEQIEQAIGTAVPVLIGGLARQSQQPGGSSMVQAALSTQPDGALLNHLDEYLAQGGAQAPTGGLGISAGDILGQVLGGKQSRVEQGVGKSSGLDPKQSGQLLAVLAPIVLAYLSRRKTQQQVPADDVGDWMGKQNRQVEQSKGGSLIGRMLDQDGDGDFDMMDMVSFAVSRLFGRKRSP